MQSPGFPRAPGSRGHALPLGLALALALAVMPGCWPADPLDEVRELQSSGRLAESLEPLRQLMETRSDEPEVQFRYGIALSATGNPSLAVWSLQEAMKSPEWLRPAALQLAAGALRTGDPDFAVEVLDRLVADDPEDVQALVQRAVARSMTRQDYEGTLADAERALELDPEAVEALVPRAVALLALERTEEAEEALEEIHDRFDEEGGVASRLPRFCAARASFAHEKGETDEAARLYDECLERFPTSALVVEAAIEFYDARNRGDRSLEILRAGLEAAPLDRGLRTALVLRLRAIGQAEEAEAILREATQAESPLLAAGAWADLGGYLLENEEFAESAAAYQRAVELVPAASPQIAFSYAEALLLAGRLEDALALADDLTVPAHRELVRARVLLEQGDAASALEHFGEGLRLWPNNPVARYYAGIAAEQVGDFDRAIEEYRYAIRAGAAQSDARLRLARLHHAEGRDDLALAALTHDIERQPGSLEMTLLELELLARTGRLPASLPPRLARTVRPRVVWGRAVAALAQGSGARSGPESAIERLRSADRLDLSDPNNAAALEALVRALAEAGRVEEAVATARRAAESRPDVAVLQEMLALALGLSGAEAQEVRAACEAALAIDPAGPLALAELARLAAADGDPEEALSLYDRAAAADTERIEAARAAALLLAASGREEEAERRLQELLARHPYDGDLALRLARLRVARGEAGQETRALLERASRFGSDPAAAELLGEPAGAAGSSG
jgi:tetratricopeptide (TPR) repeat protein